MWKDNSFKEYNNLKDFPEGAVGFVYQIKNINNNKIYIGKKNLYTTQNKKLGKKEIAALPTQPGRKPTKKLVKKESDWLTYYGSNKELKEDVNKFGKDNFIREILHICYTKKELTYYELYYQITEKVLFNESYNGNILGKFFPQDFLVK